MPPPRGQPVVTKQKRRALCSEHPQRLPTCPFPEEQGNGQPCLVGLKGRTKLELPQTKGITSSPGFQLILNHIPDQGYIFKSAIYHHSRLSLFGYFCY